jgi:hypothetical protein
MVMRFLLVVFAGCAPVPPCDDEVGMGRSPDALVLTEDEHGYGWGETECLACHALPSTHDQICLEGVDGEELRDLAQPGTCIDCHGDNGVLP